MAPQAAPTGFEAITAEQRAQFHRDGIGYVLSGLSRTVEITAEPGDCFLFDRRLWHSRSPSRSAVTRKMLFIGYPYRWIRPLGDMPIDRDGEWWRNRPPVQRQSLGEAPHTANYRVSAGTDTSTRNTAAARIAVAWAARPHHSAASPNITHSKSPPAPLRPRGGAGGPCRTTGASVVHRRYSSTRIIARCGTPRRPG